MGQVKTCLHNTDARESDAAIAKNPSAAAIAPRIEKYFPILFTAPPPRPSACDSPKPNPLGFIRILVAAANPMQGKSYQWSVRQSPDRRIPITLYSALSSP
jgi:hypothetical protein